MSTAFQSSETCINLMRAFAGESMARNRYTLAASLCRQQELPVLEAVFQFTAQQEQAHAALFYRHMAPAAGSSVRIDGAYPVNLSRDVVQLLRDAQHNEFEEFDPVYPAFASTAQAEGYPEIAAAFRQVSRIEESHGRRFSQFADLLEREQLFVSDVQCTWMCLHCGHLQTTAAAPARCPVCGHPQGFFIRLELAPYTFS